jgi:MFS family permease
MTPVPQESRAVNLLLQERPRPERVRTHPQAWRFAVATVCFGAFMGQLDASIVTLTYGSLRQEFSASLAAVQWVSLGYLVALAALLVPVGRLSDAHGRKLFYLYGFALFTAASVACGLAWSLVTLVVFRAVQAVGAALLQANSVALVATSTPRQHLRHALGLQAGAQAAGLALGPTVGGLLVSTVGWRWVFGINVPVGIVALMAGHYLLPRTRTTPPSTSLDRVGVLLLATATTSLLVALSVASGLPWPPWTGLALGALAVAATTAFVAWQRRSEHPLVAPALVQAPGVVPGLAGALAGYLVLFGPLVLVPVALQARGASAWTAGLVLTSLPVGFALAALLAERVLPARWTGRTRCGYGAALSALSLLGIVAGPIAIPWLVVTLLFLGLGLGVFTPANNSMVMGALPANVTGTGGGLVNMTRGLGTALGVAAVTLVLRLNPPEGSAAGVRWTGGLLLAVSLLMLVTARASGEEHAGLSG